MTSKKKPRRETYYRVKSNEWILPVRRGYKMACCDCCLVHRLDFRVVKGRAQFRARRDNRCTAQLRRRQNVTVRQK